jgi:hypothetical protein
VLRPLNDHYLQNSDESRSQEIVAFNQGTFPITARLVGGNFNSPNSEQMPGVLALIANRQIGIAVEGGAQ